MQDLRPLGEGGGGSGRASLGGGRREGCRDRLTRLRNRERQAHAGTQGDGERDRETEREGRAERGPDTEGERQCTHRDRHPQEAQKGWRVGETERKMWETECALGKGLQ